MYVVLMFIDSFDRRFENNSLEEFKLFVISLVK